MKTKDLTPAQWKALAIESRDQLIRAIRHFKLQGSGTFITDMNGPEMKMTHWRTMFADTLDKFPGIKVDRETLFVPEMNSKERKAYNKELASKQKSK